MRASSSSGAPLISSFVRSTRIDSSSTSMAVTRPAGSITFLPKIQVPVSTTSAVPWLVVSVRSTFPTLPSTASTFMPSRSALSCPTSDRNDHRSIAKVPTSNVSLTGCLWSTRPRRSAPDGGHPPNSRARSEQSAERPEVQVEVRILKAESLLQLIHSRLERHERASQPLDRGFVQATGLHAPERLPLHELSQKLDHREHELREPALDALGIGADPTRQRVVEPPEISREGVEIERRVQQLVGGRVHQWDPIRWAPDAAS